MPNNVGEHLDAGFDVVIVGAGPAGTAAGYDLVCAGLSVLIVDRRQFPRKKACAGGITPKAMALYAYDISAMVVHTCNAVTFRCPGGASFSATAPGPVCYMTERKDLDAFALDKVLKAGGSFLKIDTLVSLKQEKSKVHLEFLCRGRKQVVQARYLIGADGANSKIRSLLGSPGISPARYPALEADVRVEHPERFSMEFDFSKGIKGYYWIFPKQDRVNIGIYGAGSDVKMDRSLLAAYAKDRLGTDVLENIKGYPICTGGTRACAGRGRVLLAGDAAGFAEPLFGEGIYFAMKSGRLAASAIIENEPPPALMQYHRSLSGLFLDLKLHGTGAALLYRFPWIALKIGAIALVKTYFARGIARGRTISLMLVPFLINKKI